MRRILVDTSVWIDHFKNNNRTLIRLIDLAQNNEVQLLTHEMIIGEILVGGIPHNSEEALLLKRLQRAKKVTIEELEVFIVKNNLQAQGAGYVDINLLAACMLVNAELYTLDKKLKTIARAIDVEFAENQT